MYVWIEDDRSGGRKQVEEVNEGVENGRGMRLLETIATKKRIWTQRRNHSVENNAAEVKPQLKTECVAGTAT